MQCVKNRPYLYFQIDQKSGFSNRRYAWLHLCKQNTKDLRDYQRTYGNYFLWQPE